MRQYQIWTGPILNTGSEIFPEQCDGSGGSMGRAPDRQMQRPFAITESISPFSIEMIAGYHPNRNRQRLGPRIGLPISQTTHVQNAFAIDMVAGNAPARFRQKKAVRFQQPFMNNETVATSVINRKFLLVLGCGR